VVEKTSAQAVVQAARRNHEHGQICLPVSWSAADHVVKPLTSENILAKVCVFKAHHCPRSMQPCCNSDHSVGWGEHTAMTFGTKASCHVKLLIAFPKAAVCATCVLVEEDCAPSKAVCLI
jgi:hypothetical protein